MNYGQMIWLKPLKRVVCCHRLFKMRNNEGYGVILRPLYTLNMETPVKKKLGKEVVNVIRTSMRNNMDLTHIADNKANVLLSVNALIITFLAPVVISNIEMIKQYKLEFPFAILVITSVVTIYLCVLVLIPRGLAEKDKSLQYNKNKSPFFFGNFHKMKRNEYQEYFRESLLEPDALNNHIIDDLFYVGAVLGIKMSLIRLAFRIFLYGFFSSVLLTAILLFFKG
jgi:hypothetical protein